MPIDDEFHQIKNEYGKLIFENDNLSVFTIDDGLENLSQLKVLIKS